MEDRESFILIKPDGLENKKITHCLLNNLKENRIQIVDKNRIILQYEDVLVMWPAYMNCFISKNLLINYLADKEVEIWKVVGENISNKLNRIKKHIRNNYGMGCISNCIHTPYDSEEARWQYAYINKESIEINSIKEEVGYHAGLFGKILHIDKEILEKTIEDVMEERNKGLNMKTVVDEMNNNLQNRVIVKLLDQTKVSMDYAVSVLMEIFENYYSLKDIINIILDVDLYGERRLMLTSDEQACMYRDILVKKYKLDADVEKIVRE